MLEYFFAEVQEYLRCGLLGHGCALLLCERCGKSAPKLCATVRGVNIHASAAVPGNDRPRIERLCRYAARPPLAQERLEQLPDGRLRLELKNPWANGTSAFVLEPLDFIARLCAAIPRHGFHMTRFHDVLSAHSALRQLVVPKPPSAVAAAPLQLLLFEQPVVSTPAVAGDAEPTSRATNLKRYIRAAARGPIDE